MTVYEKYNVTEQEVKSNYNSMVVKQYYTDIVKNGESHIELNSVEKAVYYLRYMRE